jgi:broad specificity phosphatase PhoE
MMGRLVLITHPEVVIDPAIPVPEWPLSPVGRRRMERFAGDPLLAGIRHVVSSDERKARDGAEILSRRLGVPSSIDPGLGENDRSATGYLAPPEFWEVVDAFFARPHESVRGWERAVDAQIRVVAAARRAAARPESGDIAVVYHGGVASLLMAHLMGATDARPYAQPHGGGGCYFVVDRDTFGLLGSWRAMPPDGAA